MSECGVEMQHVKYAKCSDLNLYRIKIQSSGNATDNSENSPPLLSENELESKPPKIKLVFTRL